MLGLIGHVLNKVDFNEEDQTLSLTVDNDKVFLIKVNGDCCSSGKFIGASSDYDLDLPQKITGVKEREESFDAGDVYRVYEETYTLDNGRALTIVYDNRSNGYYGSGLDVYYGEKRVRDLKEVLK